MFEEPEVLLMVEDERNELSEIRSLICGHFARIHRSRALQHAADPAVRAVDLAEQTPHDLAHHHYKWGLYAHRKSP
jgi:hypothetical protein